MQDWNRVLKSSANSGVYHVATDEDDLQIGELASVRGLCLADIDLSDVEDKPGFLRETARALEFPDYFGTNWDALNDCLTDLSWRPCAGHVLLFRGFQSFADTAGADAAVAVRTLGVAADFWRERNVPFYAVLVD